MVKHSDLGEFPGCLVVKDSALSLLWLKFDPLAWKLPHAVGTGQKKKKKKERKEKPQILVLFRSWFKFRCFCLLCYQIKLGSAHPLTVKPIC